MKQKGWMFWLSLIVLCVIVLNLPLSMSRSMKAAMRELLAPLQGLVSSYAHRVSNAGQAIQGWGGLPEQNAKLQEEVARLRAEAQELRQFERENIRLRRQLGFSRRFGQRLQACELLSRDISGWWQTIRVAHGGSPDILKHQAVIAANGLVGRVTEVSLKTCEVLLISDPACKVSVSVGDGSGVYGVLTGQGLSWKGSVLCRMDLINKNIPIKVSDPVYTSGLGGVFPKGLLVGYVEELSMDETGLFQTALVRPSVALGDLQLVFVITEAPAEPEVLRAGEGRS